MLFENLFPSITMHANTDCVCAPSERERESRKRDKRVNTLEKLSLQARCVFGSSDCRIRISAGSELLRLSPSLFLPRNRDCKRVISIVYVS